MFALCGVNTSYTSCETVLRPDLWGKPMVVLLNSDGYVITRGAEAKALGVKMGDPQFRQKGLFRRYGVVCFSSNYELYADMSNRVMSTLEELSPRVEIYGIDEAFCNLTDVHNCRDLTDLGREIRVTMLQRVRPTIGVGVAQTETLAKLTNYAAKKWQRQTGGVVDLSNLERQRKLISTLPVDEVWGIGRRISKELNVMGIRTVPDLADSDIRFIREHFSVVLERTVHKLRGEPCLQLEGFAPTKQEVICSHSFSERITDYPSMRQAICSYAAQATERLRGEHQYCRFISMFIRTSSFASNEPCYGNSASAKLLTPTQDNRDIINATTQSLDTIWQAGHRCRKASMMLGDLFSQGVAQLNLFDDSAPRPRSEQLIAVMGTLNAKEDRGALYFAGQGIQQQWQMKHAMLSPCCTT